MLDGRVKTLHPAIHAGCSPIVATASTCASSRSSASSRSTCWSRGCIRSARPSPAVQAFDDVIEKIDIGGPAMVRAAAKNFESVAVVVDPARYDTADRGARPRRRAHARDTRGRWPRRPSRIPPPTTRPSPRWFAEQASRRGAPGLRRPRLREGRRSALRREPASARRPLPARRRVPGPLGGARVLQGKDMSFNNWLDAYAAVRARRGDARGFGCDREAQQPVRGRGRGVATPIPTGRRSPATR